LSRKVTTRAERKRGYPPDQRGPAALQEDDRLAALVDGVAIAAGCAVVAARYYRRRKARRLPARTDIGEASGK
jgi:hypothetical protein